MPPSLFLTFLNTITFSFPHTCPSFSSFGDFYRLHSTSEIRSVEFHGSAHLSRRPQLLAVSTVTGSAVNGVSQLVLVDKLRASSYSRSRSLYGVASTLQRSYFMDAAAAAAADAASSHTSSVDVPHKSARQSTTIDDNRNNLSDAVRKYLVLSATVLNL